MAISSQLQEFIEENIQIIEQNTKESWEEIYNKIPTRIRGEFTQTILDAKIDDPASIMGYVPGHYLCPESKTSNYVIPAGVTSIRDYAFEYCRSLTEIIIPDSVTSIGRSAFGYCSNLTKVVIGNSVTSINAYEFVFCDRLKSITIPNSVISIGTYAFCDCIGLTSITIPDSVTSIGDSAFFNCDSLKEITFTGTKKQAMQLGIGNRQKKKWRKDSAIQKIICSNGVIEL